MSVSTVNLEPIRWTRENRPRAWNKLRWDSYHLPERLLNAKQDDDCEGDEVAKQIVKQRTGMPSFDFDSSSTKFRRFE